MGLKVVSLNTDNGEVSNLDLSFPPRKRNGRVVMFSMVDLNSMQRLSMTQFEWKVFWAIAGAVNKETNEATIRTAKIAENLGVSGSNVSRSLSDLQKRKIIFRIAPSTWRINAWIGYRGGAKVWVTVEDPYPLWDRA